MVPAAEGDYPAEGTGTVGGMMAEKNSKRFDGIRLIAYLCTIKSGQKEKMKKCLLLIISLLTAVMAVGQTQHFFTSDELSSNQITQICRDLGGNGVRFK